LCLGRFDLGLGVGAVSGVPARPVKFKLPVGRTGTVMFGGGPGPGPRASLQPEGTPPGAYPGRQVLPLVRCGKCSRHLHRTRTGTHAGTGTVTSPNCT
jgi:hypothetical protein